MDGKVDESIFGVPRQLPPPPAHFTSRELVLTQLDSAAEHVPAVCVVFGPGGVGKTAVAVTWAVRNAARFPDGQLYVDLRGFSPGSAVVPAQVLGAFLRALGVAPERVPVELHELAALFRTTTADRRLLVVVDNAGSAEEVRPLIPASEQCAVVVTSRLRLDGLHAHGARFVDLAPLEQDQAVELLTRLVGEKRATKEQDDLDILATLCGRFPIALRVAGARLAARPGWPVARLVAELRDEGPRLQRLSPDGETPLSDVFDGSYQALPGTAMRLYRLISEHPGLDVEAGLAAAAARVSDNAAAEGLQTLVDASLLEEISYNRYRFHDLVRLHARGLPDEERSEVIGRIATWYLHQMTRANMVVLPIRWRVSTVCGRYRNSPKAFPTVAEALEWLDARLPDIVAVLEEVAEQRHDEIVWQLTEALWELFLFRKQYQEWLRTHDLGISAAHRCANPEAESRLRCQLGRAYLELGHFELAEQECAQARDLAREAGSLRNESVALDQLGMASQGRGDIEQALSCFHESLSIEDKLGIDRGVALRHRRIGEALLQAGRHDEARQHLRTAQEKLARMGDRHGAATAEIALARIDAHTGAPVAALQRLERVRPVVIESSSAAYEADLYLALAEVAQVAGDLDTARTYANDAAELCRPLGGLKLEHAEARLVALTPDEADRS